MFYSVIAHPLHFLLKSILSLFFTLGHMKTVQAYGRSRYKCDVFPFSCDLSYETMDRKRVKSV